MLSFSISVRNAVNGRGVYWRDHLKHALGAVLWLGMRTLGECVKTLELFQND